MAGRMAANEANISGAGTYDSDVRELGLEFNVFPIGAISMEVLVV